MSTAPRSVATDEGPLAKLPPHDIPAEEACIASALVDDEAISKLEGIVDDGDFFREKNAFIWSVMVDLYRVGTTISPVTVAHELLRQGILESVGGIAYLTQLTIDLPTAVGCEFYGQIVANCARHRRMLSAAGRIAQLGYTLSSVDEWDKKAADAMALLDAVRGKSSSIRIRSAAEIDAVAGVARKEWLHDPTLHRGVTTGFYGLDSITDGFQAGQAIIIAGTTSSGKTLLALELATRLASGAGGDPPRNVFYVSAEMTGEQLENRQVFAKAGINRRQVRMDQSVHVSKWQQKEADATAWWNSLPLWIDDRGPWDWPSVQARIIGQHMRGRADAVFIDHIDLLYMPGIADENRNAQMAVITRSIKALALRLNIPIFYLSQLNRSVAGRDDKMPILSDLRDSGAKEQDTDIVIAVYRPAVYEPGLDPRDPKWNELWFCVLKNRDGETGNIAMWIDLPKGQIQDKVRVGQTAGPPVRLVAQGAW